MKKKLARKLIRYYKETIKLVIEAEQFSDVGRLLRKRSINMGVCFCAVEVFDKDVYRDEWVLAQVKKKHCGYWCPEPGSAASKDGVIKCLKKRIKILKTFKKK